MSNVVRLSKLTKVIGMITIIIFSLTAIGLFITGNIGAAFCFLPFVFLGVALLLAYKKQTIVVNEDELVFNYLVKKTQHVKYKDIHCILLIPLNDRTQVALIDKKYNRITTLDVMLANCDVLYSTLEKKGIETVDFGNLVEQNKDISKYVKTLNWVERNYYKAACNEDETINKMSKSEKKEEIIKTKKILKVFGWLLIVTDVIAYIVGGKGMMIIFILVLLITFALYIKYYPYIYIEVTTKKALEHAYQLPLIGPAIALILCIQFAKLFNYDFIYFLKITAIITLLLAIPFLIKSSRIDINQRFARKLSVIFAALIIAFSIAFPVNLLLTFDEPTHAVVTVTNKHISSGRTKDRELYVYFNGENKIYTVSRSEYENTSIGDIKKICIRKSLLGLEYSTIHD